MAENNDLNAEFAENPQNRPSDGDLISRQAALNMKFSEGYNNDGVVFVPLRDVTEWIKNLPPVQPEMTDEQFKDYCRKRCLSVVTNEFMYEVRKMVPPVQPNHNAEFSKMEIVHCKDCKHFKKPSSIIDADWGWCSRWHMSPAVTFVKVDGFCHRAERRGEADE